MEPTKEKRYEDLVNAVAGGELSMVKFLWNLLERFEKVVDETPQAKVKRMQKEVDAMLKDMKENPAEDGKPGDPGKDAKPVSDRHIKKLLKPMIPKAIPGKEGPLPSDRKIKKAIKPLIPAPVPGKPGEMPEHEWDGTKIRFELPDGDWGEWTDLRGKQGGPGESFGPDSGPGGGMAVPTLIVRKGNTRFEGVAEIVFAANLTVTKTSNGISVSGENGGGGGTGLDFETPTGDVDDSNVAFTATETPLYLVVNGAQLFEGVHYSLSGLDITLNNPVGVGGFIRSAFGTGITVESPTGDIDDSNVTFTVSNEPKYVVVNGAQYFASAGYSYAGGTITLDNPVGTGGFIKSVY